MSVVIDRLHKDHINIARLLDYLDSQLSLVGTDRIPDFELMHEVMHYMTSFPDLYHHPFEDRIFSRLREHPRVDAADIDAVLAQHVELIERGRHFRSALESVMSESMMTVEAFTAAARAYIDMQRDHLNFEEGKLFRQARDYLTAADWQEIESDADSVEDPLFGKFVKAEYRHIADALD